jgi:Co/Zn/Cd efflux system component
MDGKSAKMIAMAIFNVAFAAGEIVYGAIFARSVAMVADGLHNLSDGVAFLVALYALRVNRTHPPIPLKDSTHFSIILSNLFNFPACTDPTCPHLPQASKREKSDEMTFGWGRMEVLGGLINSVALLAFCVIILIESVQRLVLLQGPDASDLGIPFFAIAGVGVFMNTFGACIFGPPPPPPTLSYVQCRPSPPRP